MKLVNDLKHPSILGGWHGNLNFRWVIEEVSWRAG